ncbi:MAG TPA: NAD(P)/FAD-dependent oxidoreductase, partial [Chloroflexia bacterium]|nr:NAD(P)/FAD-dependent oxidoreductase [Chloroflexia bacterium]
GELKPYEHLPFLGSDLFHMEYEAVGDLVSQLDSATDWTDPDREGVVYYLRDGWIRGVLLWNVWDQVTHARKLLAGPGPFTAEKRRVR